MEPTIKIEAQPGTSTILVGEALEPRYPSVVAIENSAINGPSSYLVGKLALYQPDQAHLKVNDTKLTLVLNDHAEVPDVIIGTLQLSKNIKKMGVNTEDKWSAQALAKHLKFHKFLFDDQTEANRIISSLMGFEAVITSMVTDKNDQQGNTIKKLETAVSKQVPSGFKMKIPGLYEGVSNEVILDVELCAEATSSNVQFYMQSVDIVVLVDKEARKLIDNEVSWFVANFPCSIIYLNN